MEDLYPILLKESCDKVKAEKAVKYEELYGYPVTETYPGVYEISKYTYNGMPHPGSSAEVHLQDVKSIFPNKAMVKHAYKRLLNTRKLRNEADFTKFSVWFKKATGVRYDVYFKVGSHFSSPLSIYNLKGKKRAGDWFCLMDPIEWIKTEVSNMFFVET